MPSTVVSLRVSAEQAERLQRKARQLGRSPSETGALLLDESLRRDEFAFVDFRDSPVGRQAYLEGTRVAAWQVVNLARGYHNDAAAVARHLSWPESKVRAALHYAGAFPDEIEAAIEDGRTCDFTRLSRAMPALERIEVPAEIVKGR